MYCISVGSSQSASRFFPVLHFCHGPWRQTSARPAQGRDGAEMDREGDTGLRRQKEYRRTTQRSGERSGDNQTANSPRSSEKASRNILLSPRSLHLDPPARLFNFIVEKKKTEHLSRKDKTRTWRIKDRRWMLIVLFYAGACNLWLEDALLKDKWTDSLTFDN